jgi:hypothetical protein
MVWLLVIALFLMNTGTAQVTALSEKIDSFAIAPVSFDIEQWDENEYWSPENPSVLVIPRSGRYEVVIRPQFHNNPNGQRFVYLFVNGKYATLLEVRNAVGGTYNTLWVSTDIREYQAGDLVEVRLMQNSGIPLGATATITIGPE